MARILIVEDDRVVRRSIAAFLGLSHQVVIADDGREGLQKARSEKPDLIILDIGLPKIDGVEVCRQLRQGGFSAPILFLTSHDDEAQKVTGFRVGGDDYIVKPVSLPVLQARIHAALRRATAAVPTFDQGYEWGGVRVDFDTGETTLNGEPVNLTTKEADLLRYMIRHRSTVLSREVILTEVWHYDGDVTSRTVDTHILHLRRKLEDGADGEPHIQTIRGRGYKFTG